MGWLIDGRINESVETVVSATGQNDYNGCAGDAEKTEACFSSCVPLASGQALFTDLMG